MGCNGAAAAVSFQVEEVRSRRMRTDARTSRRHRRGTGEGERQHYVCGNGSGSSRHCAFNEHEEWMRPFVEAQEARAASAIATRPTGNAECEAMGGTSGSITSASSMETSDNASPQGV